ncbi:DNA (cytosine-5-)-methyltransferase [Paenibacillus agaridevorans]|uniref:DNA (cytosine-5-)-methyltransferase n=1 Tax=Paenibacillus agaridevorans TaxID=171404 RepID=A0A2R5ELV0_9BACL|nr:DNA cytosine methyltransferase [Paenibacillus agaridevorans]GBG07646.1 DNA (cytosine-5-)-methyltransferase [Paenibacillus agaridevorans]
MVIEMEFTCIETFCGAGGLGAGLKEAGFKLLWAFDKDEQAVETYKNNVSVKVSVEDAAKLRPETLLGLAGMNKRELFLLSGGPPCQGFSRQKRGGENGDKRNRLIVKYIRMVQGIEPMFFLLENVDTFKKKRGKIYLDLLETGLRNMYEIHVKEINCADYGVPQVRKRTVVVGVRKDLGIAYEFPKPTHTNNWITVGQALRNIPTPPDDGSEYADPCYPNHSVPRVTSINIERISYVPQGSGRKCLPRRLQLPCHKKKTGWPDVYGRMAADKPAPTITGGFDNFTRGRFAHPNHNRPITAREAAVLQSFNINYKFFGNKGQVRQQIGNAVPPLLAKSLGQSIISAMQSAQCQQEETSSQKSFIEVVIGG